MQDHSVTKSLTGILSIEHIMPQSLKDPYWKERLLRDTEVASSRVWAVLGGLDFPAAID